MVDKKEKINSEELKHKTRRLSIKEGVFWTFRQAFGDHYVAPFAIAIGSSNPMVALINSMWNVSSISQIFGIPLEKKIRRKRIVSTSVFINSIGFLLMALIGFFYIKNIIPEWLPVLVLVDLFIILSAIGIAHPAWFSWMGEVVDPKYLGRWWAKRTTILTFTSIILTIITSFLLETFKKHNLESIGFIIFFMIAFLARLYCVRILNKHYEPERKKQKQAKLNFSLKELPKTNFGKFIIFRGLFALSIGITSPLIAIYLLRNLGLNYPAYILISLAGMIFSIFSLNLFGRLADKFGNYRIIAITTIFIPLTPLLWVLSSSKIYLFFVPGIIGGISWYGFLLASQNFVYDNNQKEKRAQAVAIMNLFIGTGAILGGLISAGLLKFLKTAWIEPIILIFLIGTVTSMIAVGFFIPKLREIKHKQKFKGFKEFEHIVIKELKPTLIEDAHEIQSIKNYIKEK